MDVKLGESVTFMFSFVQSKEMNVMKWKGLLAVLLGIGLAGYYFKSPPGRWKLYLGILILAVFLPLLALLDSLYWVHKEFSLFGTLLLAAIPVYYLGFLLRRARKPLVVVLFSVISLVPLPFAVMVPSIHPRYGLSNPFQKQP